MQLRKFYGRTVAGALAQVRRALGPEALILETRALDPQSPEGRLNPGARYEVLAVREGPAAAPRSSGSSLPPAAGAATAGPPGVPTPASRSGLLAELAALRDQIRDLLDGPDDDVSGRVDLSDYRALIAAGVDSAVLAPHFRAWLRWRTAPEPMRRYWAQAEPHSPAARMRGDRLREWLWIAWGDALGMPVAPTEEPPPPAERPVVVGLIGPSGSGKTTTLAKLASIFRHQKRQRSVVVTLDTWRLGAIDQWQRAARLMGIEVVPIVSPDDIGKFMETMGQFDFVGIDTPGGMAPDTEPGRRYGAILARCPGVQTVLVLPATHQEAALRAQMARARHYHAKGLIVTKLDETPRRGTLLNLTLDGAWTLGGLTAGPRVPDDWLAPCRETLWRHILLPSANGAGEAAA